MCPASKVILQMGCITRLGRLKDFFHPSELLDLVRGGVLESPRGVLESPFNCVYKAQPASGPVGCSATP